jgi:dissimilatory sulfite reductase (desulfoviridin) alpha/beta subunit
MGLEIPSLLANTLEGLGFYWTNTDENGLSAMGDTWTNFTGTPQAHASTVNGHIEGALSSNQGEGIDAMHAVWSEKDAAHQNLAIGGTGAARVGAGLQICAIVVLALKANVIVQVVNFLIEVAQAIAEAVATFGASLLEIPIFKEFTQKALGLIQNTAVNSVMAGA